MTRLSLVAAIAGLACTGVLAACAPVQGPGVYGATSAAVFNASDFDWSARSGQASIEGQVRYADRGQAYACAGSVGLTPVAAYTRQRFYTLYGSTERAAIPAAIVRARTVPDAGQQYRSYIRSENCDASGRFAFAGLPDGDWFVIVPVRAGGGEPVVLMRRVSTRAGRPVAVTLD